MRSYLGIKYCLRSFRAISRVNVPMNHYTTLRLVYNSAVALVIYFALLYEDYPKITIFFSVVIMIILYLQVKDVIQAHSGDLSATEAECARIGAEADAEEKQTQEAPEVSRRGKRNNSEDAVMAALQKQLQSTGEQVLQLQQKIMQPQTPAEVFGTYVKGTLLNLSERKFKKARTDISRILIAAMQDSDEEESPHVAPPSSGQGGRTRPRPAPINLDMAAPQMTSPKSKPVAFNISSNGEVGDFEQHS